jgi:hypothetical protein
MMSREKMTLVKFFIVPKLEYFHITLLMEQLQKKYLLSNPLMLIQSTLLIETK